MQVRSVEAIVGGWNQAGARYMIAEGLAVVAHGYLRFTADFDAILDLDEANLKRALQVLEAQGYVPRAPVSIASFADAALRQSWAREKGMTVFSLWSSEHRTTEVDLFLEPPFDFGEVYKRAHVFEMARGERAVFVPCEELVEMKRRVRRVRDLEDVARLEAARAADADAADAGAADADGES